jgi:glycosyltransferase involved in cell wall biosynthesis
VGRLAFEKNVDFLLHVLARVKERVPQVLLIISGEGPARAHLGELTERLALDDHVRFFGYLNRADELIDCYRAGDAFVFASRTETQGLVLLEAMALGVPVVATAVMGTRDVLRAGRGALVARDDPDDFAANVIRILTDAPLRAHLAHEAQAFARAWSAPRLADRMMGLYQSVLVGAPAPKAVIDSAID